MKNNQSGRTMLEMLCVLAIIGVLTLGGIQGYRYMVERYKANKIAEAIAFIVTQIRAGYSTQEDYTGITNKVAIDIGAIPEQMVEMNRTNGEYRRTGQLPTPWGGNINIFPSTLRNEVYQNATITLDGEEVTVPAGDAFIVEIGNISRQACTLLITNDWGNVSNAGFVGIAASTKTKANISNGWTPITYAGGQGNAGLNSLYLNDTRRNTEAVVHQSGAYFAYGIPQSREFPIPVPPTIAARGCNCVENNQEIQSCSFAIKVY